MAYTGVAKSYAGLYDQAVPWFSAVDRGQPKLSASTFCVGRRARAAWSTGRRALLGPGRAGVQPFLHHLPRSRQLDIDERRPDPSGPVGAPSRRPRGVGEPRIAPDRDVSYQTTASAVFSSAAQSTSRPSPGVSGAVIKPSMMGSSLCFLSPLMCSVENTSCS